MGQVKNMVVKAATLLGLGLLASGCIETGGGVSQGPKINPSKPVIVGLLVPSGSGNAQQDFLADNLVKAAKMAIAETGNSKIELRVYSTAGDANQAAGVAQKAVSEGAKILVGPLFAQAANAAGSAVAGQSVNVLSLSNNPDIAGGNVFILGDTFANTANRVVGYATSHGQRSIAALVKADAAGTVAAAAVEAAAKANGANFVGVAKYQLTTESAVASISTTKTLLQQTGATALVLDADAAGALPVFAQLLPENGISAPTTQFIGLTRWDTTSDAVRSNPGMQGSLFALNDTNATSNFNQKYAAAYGSAPHLLAGKAYDGLRAIGTLLSSGSSDALTRKKLTRSAGFSGANGVFRLRSDGTNQRALAVATFREGKIVVLDPAQRSFGGAGS